LLSVVAEAEPSEPKPRPARIRGLDGLRAVAVTLVFLHHKTIFGSTINLGNPGVMLFYALSGYLITSILLRQRRTIEAKTSRPWPEIAVFFQHRAFRIFPPYYAMIVLLVVAQYLTGKTTHFGYILVYLTYTTNIVIEFTKSFPSGLLGHFWSLAVEEQFYIISAPLFLLIAARYAGRVAIGFVVMGLVSAATLAASGMPALSILTDSLFNFGMLGVGSYLASHAKIQNGKSSLVALVGLAGLLAVGFFTAFGHLHVGPFFEALVQRTTIIFSFYILDSILKNQSSTLVNLLELWPLRALGRVSYAFYLWHGVVDFGFLKGALTEALHSAGLAKLTALLLDFGATVGIATGSWWLIERPALSMRDRMVRLPRKPKPAIDQARLPFKLKRLEGRTQRGLDRCAASLFLPTEALFGAAEWLGSGQP
jgi:peptidoglycan/LPS O-acetylase OafA/YrhL